MTQAERKIDIIAKDVYDLIVIGGGIYGIWAAFQGALEGLKVCLLEKGDFGSATSANSLKIIHGGLRYLQHLDFMRMRQSIKERRTLMRTAPHLIDPLPFILPTYDHGFKGAEAFSIALLANDIISYDRNRGLDRTCHIPNGKLLKNKEVYDLFNEDTGQKITGAALWYDGIVYSTDRLIISILISAVNAGVAACNYVEVTDFLYSDKNVTGVHIRDRLNNIEKNIYSKMILNAAGPWTDRLLNLLPECHVNKVFYPSKALNLITRQILPEKAIGIQGKKNFKDHDEAFSKGYRLFFIVPWKNYSLIGTKHLSFDKDPTQFSINKKDVDDFLEEINAAYPPAKLSGNDVIGVYGGMLPERPSPKLTSDREIQLEKHSRIIDHESETGVKGIITVVGVKWTTARLVAQNVIEIILKKLNLKRQGKSRNNIQIYGGSIADINEFYRLAFRKKPSFLSDESLKQLIRSFGNQYMTPLIYAKENSRLGQPVIESSSVVGAQIVNAAKNEMVCHLDDIILRRTELGLALDLNDRDIEKCGQCIAPILKWKQERLNQEIERTIQSIEKFRIFS